MRRTRSVLVIAGLLALALLVTGGIVFWARTRGSPEGVAAQYLAAWERGDYAAMRSLTVDAPAGFADRHVRMRKTLDVARQRFTTGDTRRGDDTATVTFTATMTLRDVGDWTYQGRLRLVPHEREWRVKWSPAALHPALANGGELRRTQTWPDRAPILAADGSRLDSGDQPGSVRQLVGALEPITEEQLEQLGSPYAEGDIVGQSGLQRQYERRLAGTPTVTIDVTTGQDDGDDTGDADGAREDEARTIGKVGGRQGEPVQTTLDPKVQAAASDALGDQQKPTALVAVRPATGEVLAVANKPGGFDRALLGRYPPGSTFKVVTAAALLGDGVSPDAEVACPATTSVGGRAFRNYEGHGYGTVSFHEAFAQSCNTTFVNLAAERLGGTQLAETARDFGFGARFAAGIPAAGGRFPTPQDDAELAAAGIGQARVLASPLHMATVAAAVADGTWRPPRLVVTGDRAEDGGGRGDAGARADASPAAGDGSANPRPASPRELEPEAVDALRQFMPSVVTEGTAASVDFPSGVAGKTGTAEYGSATGGEDPPTHAWFIGYHGDPAEGVAFAVVVEGGGVGAEVAGPVAAEFLRGL